jgi:hypothetical protein
MPIPVTRRWVWASAAVVLAAGLGAAAGTPAHADATGQRIYDNNRDSSTGRWQGWEPPVQPPGTIVSVPDVSADAAADSIHVSVVTTEGLWDIERESDGEWSTWEPAPQPPDTPVTDMNIQTYQTYSAGEPNGDIEFFQVYKGALWYSIRTASDGRWSEWTPTAETVPADLASLAVTATGGGPGGYSVQFLAATTSGALWHDILTGAGQWQGWEQPEALPGGAESIAAAGLTNGDTEFIAISRNGFVYHTIRLPGGAWQNWAKPRQPPAGWYGTANTLSISAAADYYGDAQFVIWALDLNTGVTTVYHTIRDSEGNWQSSGWGTPAMPNGSCIGTVAIPTFTSVDTDLHLDAYCVT